MRVEVVALVRDEGTVVVFDAFDRSGRSVLIAVDHRSAQAIIDALEADPYAESEVYADVEGWQVIG